LPVWILKKLVDWYDPNAVQKVRKSERWYDLFNFNIYFFGYIEYLFIKLIISITLVFIIYFYI
jgi:hypothetical protein